MVRPFRILVKSFQLSVKCLVLSVKSFRTSVKCLVLSVKSIRLSVKSLVSSIKSFQSSVKCLVLSKTFFRMSVTCLVLLVICHVLSVTAIRQQKVGLCRLKPFLFTKHLKIKKWEISEPPFIWSKSKVGGLNLRTGVVKNRESPPTW